MNPRKMDYTTPEILEFLQDHFNHYKEDKEEVWRIKLNGSFFKTAKGKASWARQHLARAAFRNHIEHSGYLYHVHTKFRVQNPELNHWQNKPTNEENADFINQLEEKGFLEFVQV